ncbi:MAG: hypothetical protein OEL87_02620, partial [Nanoarchaeota archaeon]|nr:hypothetical protein [Nanoarchaeota archaeon]
MKGGKFLEKKVFISLISILSLLLFFILIIHARFDFNLHKTSYSSEVKDMIDQRMKSLLFQMNVFPKYIGDELLFLSRMSSMKEV